MAMRTILAVLFVTGALSLNIAGADSLRPASALTRSAECGQLDGPLCSISRGCRIIFIPPYIFIPYCWEVVKYYPDPEPPEEPKDDEETEG